MLSSIYSYWTSAIFVIGGNIQSLNIEKITWGEIQKFRIVLQWTAQP